MVIVSPALVDANNGNWRTARRWQELLSGRHPVRITKAWPDAQADGDTLMLALHARRSAAPIAAWAQRHPGRGLAVVLTGTDLYQDIATDADARRSLDLAQRLVVLQELGPQALPPEHRGKARVIFQSTPALPALPKPADRLQAVMVGHLRQVKSPQTLWAAARLLRDRPDLRLTHIGDGAGEPSLAEEARATARDCPGYQWLGGLPYDDTVRLRRRQAAAPAEPAPEPLPPPFEPPPEPAPELRALRDPGRFDDLFQEPEPSRFRSWAIALIAFVIAGGAAYAAYDYFKLNPQDVVATAPLPATPPAAPATGRFAHPA